MQDTGRGNLIPKVKRIWSKGTRISQLLDRLLLRFKITFDIIVSWMAIGRQIKLLIYYK